MGSDPRDEAMRVGHGLDAAWRCKRLALPERRSDAVGGLNRDRVWAPRKLRRPAVRNARRLSAGGAVDRDLWAARILGDRREALRKTRVVTADGTTDRGRAGKP